VYENYELKSNFSTYLINVCAISFEENKYLFEIADRSLKIKPLLVADSFIEKHFLLDRRKIVTHLKSDLKKIVIKTGEVCFDFYGKRRGF
jgi:hypothetical protein